MLCKYFRGKGLVYALLLVGFISVTGQVVLMREFMTVFYGNELSLGLILANWLFLVAVGGYISSRLIERFNLGLKGFVTLQILAALTLPTQILAVRIIRHLLGISGGELIDLIQIILSSLLILSPLCLILGFQFTLGCRIYAKETKKKASGIGGVYVFEALGSLIGGVFFSYLLVHYLGSFQIAFLIALLSLTSALILLRPEGSKSIHTVFISLLLVLAALCFFNTTPLETLSSRLQWGDDLIISIHSVYGNIVVLERDDQYSFYENGVLMYTTRDTELNEELIHYPMLEHPNPKKILLIGGGAGGALKEILKHPVDKVTYVELDPKIIEVSRKYLPREDLEALDDPRVDVVMADGRFFIKECMERYDVVIVNLPEPSTAQLNRFYTREFFTESREVLNEKGIISIGIPSSESYVGEGKRVLGSSIYKTMKSVYPELILIPGERSFLLASETRDLLTYNPKILNKRFMDRGLETKHLDKSLIRYKLSMDRVDYILSSLNEDASINTDLKPIGYYYGIMLWGSLINPGFMNHQNFISEIKFYDTKFLFLKQKFSCSLKVFISIPVIILIFLFWRSRRYSVIPPAVFIIGFTGMVCEVVALIAFQVLYGFLYYKIAVIIAAFMAGLALGGSFMNRIMKDKGKKLFTGIMFLLAVYLLLLPVLFTEIFSHTKVLSAEIFPVLMVAAGFLVGLEFPLASKLYMKDRGVAQTAGAIYASDLLGACLGAILSSIILIPLIGIINTCILAGILNIVAGLIVFYSR